MADQIRHEDHRTLPSHASVTDRSGPVERAVSDAAGGRPLRAPTPPARLGREGRRCPRLGRGPRVEVALGVGGLGRTGHDCARPVTATATRPVLFEKAGGAKELEGPGTPTAMINDKRIPLEHDALLMGSDAFAELAAGNQRQPAASLSGQGHSSPAQRLITPFASARSAARPRTPCCTRGVPRRAVCARTRPCRRG